ncbi:MAG: filamentous hemagglutinin N-terminal domain-containing protein [Gammaproteobacteria bacterium]|nr:filamentous hemagglutinin N-terminal domain-containing protein [Gammaproteobacteria bacterium]
MTAKWTTQDPVALRFHSLNKTRAEILLLALLLVKGLSDEVHANGGIVTDGSVGFGQFHGTSTTLMPDQTNTVTITPEMGTTSISNSHANAFYSFKTFNVDHGQTVNFSEPNFVDNVIARVTGQNVSQIDGKLSVTQDSGHANFYLLNPNGILFGKGASIDVPGDFHVTTAHFIKFQDGAKFGSDPVHSHLTSAAPASFGFTSSTKGNNVLLGGKGAIVIDGANLNATSSQKSIDLVANKITIENGATISSKSSGDLKEGGDIRLVAAKGDTTVTLKRDAYGNLQLPKFALTATNAGKIEITGDEIHDKTVEPIQGTTAINTSGVGGGRVAIWGHDVRLKGDVNIGTNNNEGYKSAGASQGVFIVSDNLYASGSIIRTNEQGYDNDFNPNGTIITSEKFYSPQIDNKSTVAASSGSLIMKAKEDIIINFSGGGKDGVRFLRTNGGKISMTSGDRIALNNANIEDDASRGVKASGDILIYSDKIISMYNSRIYSLGDISGSVKLTSHDISMRNNSSIQDSTSGSSEIPSGGIRITAYGGFNMTDNSHLTRDDTYRNKTTNDGGLDVTASHININKSDFDILNEDISVSAAGNIFLIDSLIRNSSYENNSSPSGKSTDIAGKISINSDTLLIKNSFMLTESQFNSGGDLSLNIGGLFVPNHGINGNYYTYGDNITGPNKAFLEYLYRSHDDTYLFKNEHNKANVIATIGTSGNTVISGTLLNLSGAMANLGTPSFESDALSNSCDVIDKGSLMSGGKGGKGLNAMDRMIFGE